MTCRHECRSPGTQVMRLVS